MIRIPALAAGLVLLTVACGASSQSAQGTTLETMSVRTNDLPPGMVRCDLSGDISSFLGKEKSADPATYATVKSDWDAAKTSGATAAYAALYADSSAHCAQLRSSAANPGAATYQVVINFIIQFTDASSAATGYADGSFFNFSVSGLKSAGAAVTEGAATGLTDNSIAQSAVLAGQTVSIQIWQNQSFLVILAALNIDPAASQKAAEAENARIK